MTTFVALLRSINVGGRNRVLMADLVSLVESLGFDDVETYVQSGNVVFSGSGTPRSAAQAIEAAITDQLGLEVPVIVRSAKQLSGLLEVNPFLRSGADPKHLHVTLLAGPPGRDRRQLVAGSEAPSATTPTAPTGSSWSGATSSSTARAGTARPNSTMPSSSAGPAWWRPPETGGR